MEAPAAQRCDVGSSGDADPQQCSPPTAQGMPAQTDQEGQEEYDPEMGQWLVRTLQKVQPGAELTMGSIKTLTTLLDGITQRILEEAKHIGAGTGPDGGPGAGQTEGSSAKPLTSLDIHKALKRVLPGDPTENRLRPYLPAITKQAWHLDKQSLKGVKKLKTAAMADSGSILGAIPAAAAGKANGSMVATMQQQQQQ